MRKWMAALAVFILLASGAQALRPGFGTSRSGGFAFPNGGIVPPFLPTPGFDATGALSWWDFNKTAGDGSLLTYYNTVGASNGGSTTVAYSTDLLGHGYDIGQGNKDYQPTKGPNGGAQFDTTASNLQIYRTDLLNGLPQFSVCMKVRPLAGTASRVLFTANPGPSTVSATGVTVGIAGTGYQVGDFVYFTGAVVIQVTSVNGVGGITGVNLTNPGSISAAPSQPQSQTSTNTPSTGAAGGGTAGSFTISYTNKGSVVRLGIYVSAGSVTRKIYSSLSAQDATSQSTSTTNGTSLGATNGGALTDTTTPIVFCEEVDLPNKTVSFYRGGVLDGTVQTIAPAETPLAFNNVNSTSITLGNNAPVGTTPSLVEVLSAVTFDHVLSASQNASVAGGL